MNISDLSMSYGEQLLFLDVNLILKKKEKYGLVGANGAGKTTFLNLLTKQIEPLSGEIITNKHETIGYLKQDQFLFHNETILNVVIAGDAELYKVMKKRDEILKNAENLNEAEAQEMLDIENKFASLDGYSAHSKASELLRGLGIEKHDEPLSSLSGGFKLRTLLAKTLFANPNILLLDEPTNHLDVKSIIWLEKYLKHEFHGVLVFISHDIGFLNGLSTYILDVDYGNIKLYYGNYNKFLIKKDEEKEILAKQVNNSQKKINQLQKFIDRFGAKASMASRAKSMTKRIDKMDKPNMLESSRRYPQIAFASMNCPRSLLEIKNLSKSFQEKQLLNNINFQITKNEKIVILGENGIGKSTLLKIITNSLKPNKGSFEWNEKVKYNYFAQDHHEELKVSQSAIEWIMPACQGNIQTAMQVLKQVLLKDVEKNILNLSGGESAKLLFAKMMLTKSNMLIFDEPTNHLDVESVLALQEALIKFPGSVILVTHDRSFANAVANRIIYIQKNKIIDYQGNYEEFIFAHKILN